MKAILVDDEYYSLQGLRMELELIDDVEITGLYDDQDEALQAILAGNCDVVFLDIDMPKKSGLELSREIIEKVPAVKIVFVTAYNQYAVEAFELNSVDYIMKPARKDRILKTINRIRAVIDRNEEHPLDSRRLRFHCFSHFSIFVGSEELNSKWRTKKAEELLAFLLKEKGRFVSKEKIAETLWSDMDGEKGISNLYLAYYYLKKQLEDFNIRMPVESQRGKMRIVLKDVYCDMIEFDDCLAKCVTIDDQTVVYAKRALELYRGMPFEDKYYFWTIEIQQFYEMAYSELLNRMGTYFEEKGDRRQASYYKEQLHLYEV